MTVRVSILHRSPEERRNLLVSLCASLLLHGVGFSVWILAAAAMLSLNHALLADLERARAEAQRRAEQQIPTVFVEVNPATPAEPPPPETPNYSTQNSKAANPDPTRDTGTPMIDGTKDTPLRTVDVLRPAPTPPSPDIEKVEPRPPSPRPTTDPKSSEGDLTVAADPAAPGEAREKPASLLEARMKRGGLLAGLRSKQDGGVHRRGALSLDAKASPFGVYDATLIAAIQKRWYDLLDESALAPRAGRVVVDFTLHYDGRVTDINALEQDVGEVFTLYCTKAISDPAPYPEWPAVMRRAIGKDQRVVRITFYYF